jgi:hypothetical protein
MVCAGTHTPSFGTVVGPPLLCQEAGRIARMSAIRI